MKRSAVVCLLLLAALVGRSASLDDRKLTALGERLLALQSDIKENSTYQPLTRSQAASAKLAFFEADDPYITDYIPNGWGDPYGGIYEPNGEPYPIVNVMMEPQTSFNYDVPVDYDYLNTLPTGWRSEEFNIDYGATQILPAAPAQFDGGYGSPVDWNTAILETPFPEVNLPPSPSYVPQGGSLQEQSPPNVYYTGDQNSVINNLTVEERNILIYRESLNIVERQNYALGLGGPTAYTPMWYERAFPGWGTTVIPLLPPQYQPYGYGNNCYGGTGITAGLAVSSNGTFGVGIGVGAQNYPCSSYYSSIPITYQSAPVYGSGYYGSQIQPTCSITLADATIAYGSTAILNWNSYNASSASLNGIGTVSLSGTRTLPNQFVSRTYGLTVAGPGGTGACYVTLAVAAKPVVR